MSVPFSPFTRREFIKGTVAGAAFVALPHISLAANPTGQKLHGLSSFGDLKYPDDYPHFDFANPDAPNGGTMSFAPSNWAFNQNVQTFNTLNTFVLKGAAPPRMELCFDSLMVWAIDEPDAIYCALAKSVEISEDRNTFRFELRPEARFHDGSPVTAADVAFSYNTIREKGHPQLALDLRHLSEAVAIDTHVVELRFNGNQSARAILSLALGVPVLSAKYYEKRKFDASSQEAPLGSGPWKVGSVNSGKTIIYERVKDYWAKDLPFAKGLDHFDFLRIDFYKDRTAAFEALKKGETTWRQEFTSKAWATEYTFPAVQDGRVVLREFPSEKTPAMQAWALNSRRKKFADARVREAIGILFDFEWTNENIFFGAYARSQSCFERSDLKAEGLPTEKELALLNEVLDEPDPAIMGEPYIQNVTNGSGKDRSIFRKALRLLKAAGFETKNGKQVSPDGEQLTIEILIRSPVFERLLGKFVQDMERAGIDAEIRLVDPSQFQSRLDSFDFDMVGIAFGMAANPTEEGLRQMFHSESADRPGSRNYPGIKVPAIDKLLEKIGEAETREELVVIVRALDRVLRAQHLWIPNWYSANHRVAMWDMFGWSDPKPDYSFPIERLWWFDEAKARKIGRA